MSPELANNIVHELISGEIPKREVIQLIRGELSHLSEDIKERYQKLSLLRDKAIIFDPKQRPTTKDLLEILHNSK